MQRNILFILACCFRPGRHINEYKKSSASPHLLDLLTAVDCLWSSLAVSVSLTTIYLLRAVAMRSLYLPSPTCSKYFGWGGSGATLLKEKQQSTLWYCRFHQISEVDAGWCKDMWHTDNYPYYDVWRTSSSYGKFQGPDNRTYSSSSSFSVLAKYKEHSLPDIVIAMSTSGFKRRFFGG